MATLFFCEVSVTGYDMLLSAVVLGVLSLVGWAVKFWLTNIEKPRTDAHLQTLGVIQQAVASQSEATGQIRDAMVRVRDDLEAVAERLDADRAQLRAIGEALREILDGLDRLEKAIPGADLSGTRARVKELLEKVEKKADQS
jgi:molecular chaperone GrpE (heat shock protein)